MSRSTEKELTAKDTEEISKADVLRAIEKLKARDERVLPNSVARILGVVPSFLYSNVDFLESIYRYGSEPIGPDLVIRELIHDLKSAKRKLDKQTKQLFESEIKVKKSYSDGFSEGAALNFNTKTQEDFNWQDFDQKSDEELEIWARGVLFISPDEVISIDKVKSSYRNLIRIVHPDTSGLKDSYLVQVLNRAYEVLMARYS